ncbi:MDR family MFS transporter [Frigidibacter sp. ROC022]|uniref:MDR family MFS transporter n=1 Tax=Frigidibacter sp. ROC022 TaxID=2971796 RepID=UPI00215AE515|nr:MFS transporter [Frigidibacter sp. ROC022]
MTNTTQSPDARTAAPVPSPDSAVRVVIGSVAVLLLLASLDQTIVSTALPTIVADLGGLEHLSWVVTAYILASTIVAPLYGKMGDLYGRRVMVFISVGMFLTGSALCGLSQSMTFLIVSRALQGLGGGGLFVLALSIIGDVIAPKDRGKVQGVFAAVFSTSSVIGPLLGGWFVENLSWHWIFYINIPLGLAAVVGFTLGFKAHPDRVSHKIDYAGAIALSLTLGATVLVTSLGGRTLPWSSPMSLGLMALALLSLAAFLMIERRAAEPILPLGLFRLNVFWVTCVIGFVAGASMFGSITFIPVFLQIAQGSTPTVSGWQLIPMTAGIMSASTLAGQYMGRTGKYRILTRIGTSFLIVGMLTLSTITDTTPYPLIGFFILLVGLGMGCIFPVLTTAVQNAVPRQQLGTATAAGLMFRQVGGSMAVALFGALFASGMASRLGAVQGAADLGGGLEIGPQMMAAMPPDLRESAIAAVVGALHPIYWIAAGIALVGFGFSLILEERPLTNRMVHKSE